MTLTHGAKYLSLFLVIGLLGCNKVQPEPVRQVLHSENPSYAASIDQAGNKVAVSAVDAGVTVWDIHNDTALYALKHQGKADNQILALSLSPDGSSLATADSQNFALWQMSDGKNLGFWAVKDATIRDLAVADNGQSLLIAQSDGKVQHLTLATGRRLEFLGHSENVNSVDLSANGRFALSGSNDHYAYFWDTNSAQIIYSFPHPNRVTKVVLDQQGRYAFTSGSEVTAFIWDLKTGKKISQLALSRAQIITAARFSPDGRFLVTGSPSRALALWDVHSGKKVQQWQVRAILNSRPASAVVHAVAFLSDQQIISESSSGIAEVWEVRK
ncbi:MULTISPECIES: WD40 repeat domain-containing protein [Rheinheimera]|uniref:WD40 repeat domain-containing protein n=1 Tax=Rheinheimera marina TaxID=1774958 RepID=A0ABV9JGS5_9GAMM